MADPDTGEAVGTAAGPPGDVLIATLGLEPHPEGGHFRRTFTHPDVLPGADGRHLASAILYLLRAGERSHWHRVDAEEVWSSIAGAPVRLRVAPGGADPSVHLVGPDPAAGHEPVVVVPAGAWQSAEPTGAYGLVSCVVVPEFSFAGFELAPPGWSPGGGVHPGEGG